MIAIFKRELKSYFRTVVGWLFLAAVLALYGLYFYAYNLRGGYPYISYTLSAISFIMLLTVPVLTMRSFAEEHRSRTDQMILTAPVSVGKIVLGKYLAMAGVFTAAMAVVAVTPLILSIWGTVPMGENYAAILGFYLYGCTCIAIGMFLSATTESQVIAAVLTFAALFLGYMMESITGLISVNGNLLTAVLGTFDLYTPLESFMNGCIDLTGVVYFLSVICLCQFLCCQLIQKRRYSFRAKKLSLGAFSIGSIVLAFAVTVGINLVARELPSDITSVDATSEKLYSITDATRDFLDTLEEDVTIYVLAAEKNADSILSETLARYEDLSKHISIVYINPAANPVFYQQYTDTAPAADSLIVVSGQRSRVIDFGDIYEYSYDYTSYSSTLEGYDGEGQITSALAYVTMPSSELPALYEINGHGETALSGGFLEAVEKSNMTLKQITLLKEAAIPEDAAAVIIYAPDSDFSEDDAEKVKEYLDNGGKALIVTNYEHKNLTNFESILSDYGIGRVEGIVMENDASYYYNGIPYYLLPEIESSSYTASVSGKYVFAPYSEGLSYAADTEEMVYTPLLTVTDAAVSKVNAANATTSELEEGDIAGPFNIALAVEKTAGENVTQIIAAGSLDLFTDAADAVVSGGNVSLFTNCITALAGTGEETAAIPVKSYTVNTITVTSIAAMLGGLAASILLPILLVAAGIVIWAVRRKR